MPKVLVSPLPSFRSGPRSQTEWSRYAANPAQGKALDDVLRAAAAAGADGCLCLYSDEMLPALKRTLRQYPEWTIYPVVPNIPEYSRAVNQHGMVRAGIRRLRGLRLIALARLGLFTIPKAAKAIKRDMRALLPILVEVEMMAFVRLRPSAVLLHSGVTDLAMANNNPSLIHSFTRLVRSRYRVRPGLMTQNLRHALVWIRSEGLDVDVLAARSSINGWQRHPANPNPEQSTLGWEGELIAMDPFSGRSPGTVDGQACLSHHGFDGLTVQVGGFEDLPFLAEVVGWLQRSRQAVLP